MSSSVIEMLCGPSFFNRAINSFMATSIEFGVELVFLLALEFMTLALPSYCLPPRPRRTQSSARPTTEVQHPVSSCSAEKRCPTNRTIRVQHSVDSYPPTHSPISTSSQLSSQNNDISWEDVLSQLINTDWEPQELNRSDEVYQSRIRAGFGLEYIPFTQYIWHNGTDTIVARCENGVYGFGVEFEYGYLISETNSDALRFMLNPGSRPKGPTRRGWGTYDVTAEDIFGDKYGEEEEEEEDGYISNSYDSGFEDCNSPGAIRVYR